MYLTSGDVDRIVYFVRYRRGKYVLEPHVDFGIISDVYESDRKVYVDYLTMYDCMLINGISIQQFDRTPMKKLPKGWTYNAELYTITWDHTKPESKIDKRYPATIKRAFDSGVLIRCDESHEYRYKIDAVVTKDGYYVKKTPRGLYNDGWRPVGNTYSLMMCLIHLKRQLEKLMRSTQNFTGKQRWPTKNGRWNRSQKP